MFSWSYRCIFLSLVQSFSCFQKIREPFCSIWILFWFLFAIRICAGTYCWSRIDIGCILILLIVLIFCMPWNWNTTLKTDASTWTLFQFWFLQQIFNNFYCFMICTYTHTHFLLKHLWCHFQKCKQQVQINHKKRRKKPCRGTASTSTRLAGLVWHALNLYNQHMTWTRFEGKSKNALAHCFDFLIWTWEFGRSRICLTLDLVYCVM